MKEKELSHSFASNGNKINAEGPTLCLFGPQTKKLAKMFFYIKKLLRT